MKIFILRTELENEVRTVLQKRKEGGDCCGLRHRTETWKIPEWSFRRLRLRLGEVYGPVDRLTNLID